ncbi:MAG: hypothetical protein ACRED3_16105, partial [Bradyrhizobium sp.]
CSHVRDWPDDMKSGDTADQVIERWNGLAILLLTAQIRKHVATPEQVKRHCDRLGMAVLTP